jgi:hypothetical protein
MFLRRYERRAKGGRRTYWALVESVRTGRGSRQRMVAYLGELERSEQSGWAQLGRNLSGKQRPSRSSFDPPHYDEPSDDEPVLVRLRDVRFERLRDFGDVWMAWGLWRLLGLDKVLDGLMPAGREEVAWPTVAAILTIARFCEPQRGPSRKRKSDARTIPGAIGKVAAADAVLDRVRPPERRKRGQSAAGSADATVLARGGRIRREDRTVVLWKTLAQWMRRSGLGDAPRTVLEELAKIKSGDVVLPTLNSQGSRNGEVRLRCVTEPDQA